MSVVTLTKQQIDGIQPVDIFDLGGKCWYKWIEIQDGYVSCIALYADAKTAKQYIQENLTMRGIAKYTYEPYKLSGVPYLTKLLTYAGGLAQSILVRVQVNK